MSAIVRRASDTLRVALRPTSARLKVVAGYFRVSAVVGALSLAGAGGAALVGNELLRASLSAHPVRWAALAAMCGFWWRIGGLLGDRRREGLWLALGSFAVPVVTAIAGGGGVAAPDVAVSLVGAALAASTVRELR